MKEDKPGKKFGGYLAVSTFNPYASNCYSYTHFKKTLTEECETKDIPNWRKEYFRGGQINE